MNFDVNTILPLLLMNGKNAGNEQMLSMIKLLSNANLFQNGNNNANRNTNQNAKINANPFEQLFNYHDIINETVGCSHKVLLL